MDIITFIEQNKYNFKTKDEFLSLFADYQEYKHNFDFIFDILTKNHILTKNDNTNGIFKIDDYYANTLKYTVKFDNYYIDTFLKPIYDR